MVLKLSMGDPRDLIGDGERGGLNRDSKKLKKKKIKLSVHTQLHLRAYDK